MQQNTTTERKPRQPRVRTVPQTQQQQKPTATQKNPRGRGKPVQERKTPVPSTIVTEFSASPTVVTSAVIIKPPQEQWQQIQAIRAKYDKAYERWMPHINLLYPFLPAERFRPSMITALTDLLKDVKPFTVRLNAFEHFVHGKSATFFLPPTNALPHVRQLHTRLMQLFPQCTDLERENGFSPHLTCGQYPLKDYEKFKQDLMETFSPIEWVVDEICLISREGMKFSIPLHAGSPGNDNDEPAGPLAEVLLPLQESRNRNIVANRIIKWVRGLAHTADKNASTQHARTNNTNDALATSGDALSSSAGHPSCEPKWPKSRAAFANAIKQMCVLNVPVTTVDFVYDILLQEGFIQEVGDELAYLKTPEDLHKHVPTVVNSKELRGVLASARVWTTQKANSPKSKPKLLKCLAFLVTAKTELNAFEMTDYLVDINLLVIADSWNGSQRLEVLDYSKFLTTALLEES